jgi:GNAT superfamily N-acetyltransferase
MPAYHFDTDYCEVATLRDGRKVHVRLIRPSDKELIRRGFERMSPDSRYKRFFSPKARLSNAELRYLTELDQVNHLAIGAERLAGDGGDAIEGLGVARFVRYEDMPDMAEAAVAVIDEMQGKGLGSLLLQRLIAAAHERGIRRLRFEVLGSNHPMKELVKDLAPSARTLRCQGGVSVIECELPPLSPSHPVDVPPRQTSLYKLFSLAARGTVTLRGADRSLAELAEYS